MPEEKNWEVIFVGGPLAAAHMKGLLEAHGITVVVQDTITATWRMPWDEALDGPSGAKVLVHPEQFETAKWIIESAAEKRDREDEEDST